MNCPRPDQRGMGEVVCDAAKYFKQGLGTCVSCSEGLVKQKSCVSAKLELKTAIEPQIPLVGGGVAQTINVEILKAECFGKVFKHNGIEFESFVSGICVAGFRIS